MSIGYKAIQWSRHKRIYDTAVAGAAIASIVAIFAIGKATWGEGNSDIQLAIRALGLTAILLLHIILAIGPLARLDRRFLPLLFNRRHLGVTMFLIGLAHAVLSILFYHTGGVVNPLISVLTGGPGSGHGLPFEIFGVAALIILFLMAATSHDFWLKNLGSRAWKRLHMLVYVAYVLLVLHVAFGAIQSERSPVFPSLLGLGAAGIVSLHIMAGRREVRRDREVAPTVTPLPDTPTDGAPWVDACGIDDIPEGRARPCPVRHVDGRIERVAVFKYPKDGRLVVSATTNVCAHQGGPLGEGKVIDGCATCPWHGWQYHPHDGCSPPPFVERIPTYRVRVLAGRILVDPRALPPGTPVEPAAIDPREQTAPQPKIRSGSPEQSP